MMVLPMHRIRLWAEKTNREILRDKQGRFHIPGVTATYLHRPSFRRICSVKMRKEGHW